ncbi:predicted protein [Histoplasma capsulatum G186AR]|uniref:Uncharacterized protein n=1 Tax=Ajellomyces capsulatus (strain G186AR / H82 / ATCC MYA-2454 / RMSCC 2432) TaxID=447093 RepID=C0NSN8_AJECG|nr:uncharacterized protein HCBG_06168 [Histoplasma capsulatum G186AR]EEH05904.1 predicted protein [Histoplasma capsulatum G186AR]
MVYAVDRETPRARADYVVGYDVVALCVVMRVVLCLTDGKRKQGKAVSDVPRIYYATRIVSWTARKEEILISYSQNRQGVVWHLNTSLFDRDHRIFPEPAKHIRGNS